MRFLLFSTFLLCQASTTFALSIDDVVLPDLASSESDLIDQMPDPRKLRFDPIAIQAFPAELESFRKFKIERYNAKLKARCDHIDLYDAYVRNVLIPSQISWDHYESVVKGQILSEKKKCDIKNEASEYATIYHASIDQLKRFSDVFGTIQALCANSPSCTIGNDRIAKAY